MDVVVVVIFWSEQSMEMMLSQGRMDQSWQCCNDQYVNTDLKYSVTITFCLAGLLLHVLHCKSLTWNYCD